MRNALLIMARCLYYSTIPIIRQAAVGDVALQAVQLCVFIDFPVVYHDRGVARQRQEAVVYPVVQLVLGEPVSPEASLEPFQATLSVGGVLSWHAHRSSLPPSSCRWKADASALATGQTQRYDALLDFHTLGPQHRPEESIHGRLPPGCGCWRGSEDRCRPRLRASESGIAPAVSLLWGSLCAPRICCSDGARSLWDCRPRRPAARAQSWNWSSCRLLTSREHGCRPRGTRSTSLGCRRRPLSHCRQALSWSAHT